MSKTNYSTYSTIKSQLFDIFKTETFENNKLPSEAQLAEVLDISLSTLREILMVLALEGYITKRHGAGNFLHPSTLDFGSRSVFFTENLKRSGYTVKFKLLEQAVKPAGPEVAEALGVDENDPTQFSTLLHYADDVPAILTTNAIPEAFFTGGKAVPIQKQEFEYLHEMVWRHCRHHLAHSLNEYRPRGLPADVAALFGLPEGTPSIANPQVFYDTYDKPVMYCFNYFYPDKYKIRTLQNWALGQSL